MTWVDKHFDPIKKSVVNVILVSPGKKMLKDIEIRIKIGFWNRNRIGNEKILGQITRFNVDLVGRMLISVMKKLL